MKRSCFKGCFCSKAAFTLIELLVVVLIIGILAAVAVPQYQKAVVKSKNAEMKQIIRTVADAEQAYYLANGKYADNFNELDIDLPLTPVKTTVGGRTGACNISTSGTDSSRQAKDYYMILNTHDPIDWFTIAAYWSAGTYKCAGFAIIMKSPLLNDKHNELICREMKNTNNYQAGPDAFCRKIEQGTQLDISDANWRLYRLP